MNEIKETTAVAVLSTTVGSVAAGYGMSPGMERQFREACRNAVTAQAPIRTERDPKAIGFTNQIILGTHAALQLGVTPDEIRSMVEKAIEDEAK